MPAPKTIEIEMKVNVDCPIKGACPHVKAHESDKAIMGDANRKRIAALESEAQQANKICDACEKKHDENSALLETRVAELEAERDAAQAHIKELYDERGKRMIMWDAIVAERDSLRIERDAARTQYKAASVRADLHEANGATAIHGRDALRSRIDAAIKFIHRNGPNAQDAAEDRILRTLLGMHLKDAGTATADFERATDEIKPCPCCFRTGQPRNQPACAPDPEKARADELQKRIDKAVEIINKIEGHNLWYKISHARAALTSNPNPTTEASVTCRYCGHARPAIVQPDPALFD